MEQKINIRWDRWKKHERVHITKISSLGIATLCLLFGIILDKAKFGLVFGLTFSLITFWSLSLIRRKR